MHINEYGDQESILMKFLSVSRRVVMNIAYIDLDDLKVVINELEAILERIH